MKIALTQFAASENPADNLKKQAEMISSAASDGAKIVCTQELFMSKYFCIDLDAEKFGLAERIPSPTTDTLCSLAKKLDIVIIASLFESRGNEIYHNTAVTIDADGKIAGKYRKMHIPHDPHFEEKYYFTPGDLGYGAVETKYGKLGVLVCWDQWYPEAARAVSLNGAEIIFYPTAIGGLNGESEAEVSNFHNAWQTVQCGHAVANGVYVAAANRVGIEKSKDGSSINFWGGSFCSDPYGNVVSKASKSEEQILFADVDFNLVRDFRRTWPFFRDRRADSYSVLGKKFCD